MNEIIAVLYYCFANDNDEELLNNAEIATYYCFSELIKN